MEECCTPRARCLIPQANASFTFKPEAAEDTAHE